MQKNIRKSVDNKKEKIYYTSIHNRTSKDTTMVTQKEIKEILVLDGCEMHRLTRKIILKETVSVLGLKITLKKIKVKNKTISISLEIERI